MNGLSIFTAGEKSRFRYVDMSFLSAVYLIYFYIQITGGRQKRAYHNKIRRFYGKIPGIWPPVLLPLFLRASTCRTFLEIKIW